MLAPHADGPLDLDPLTLSAVSPAMALRRPLAELVTASASMS
jgi:hypothetical protein